MIYILVDENSIVRCVASHMDKYHVEMNGIVGDEYNPLTDTWTPRPENYPQPTQAQADEQKIEAEMRAIQRAEAIQALKDKGELPIDYKDE